VRDVVLLAVIVIAFALFVTVHLAIACGLLLRKPRWRAPLALVIVPLAPYWAWREHMRVRAAFWAGTVLVYVAARIVAGG
jgi:hypothetical protein